MKLSIKIIVFSIIFAHYTYALTLEEAIDYAINNNTEIQDSHDLKYKAKIVANEYLGQIFIPKSNVSFKRSMVYNKEYNNNTTNNISFLQGIIKWDLLYIPKKIMTYRMNNTKLQLLNWKHQDIIETVIRDTIDKYYKIVILKKKKKFLKNSLNLSKTNLNEVQSKFKMGAASKSEVLEAQVGYNDSYAKLLEIKEEILLSTMDLREHIGIDMDKSYIKPGSTHEENDLNTEASSKEEIPYISDQKIHIAELSLDNLITLLETNPKIKILQMTAKISKINLAINNYKLWTPNVFTFLEFENKSPQMFFTEKNTSIINFGIGIKFDIYRMMLAYGDKQIYKYEYSLNENKRKLKTENIKSTLQDVYTIYNHYKDKIQLQKKNLDISKQNLEMQTKRYNLGAIKLMELNIAIHKHREAGLALLNTIYNAKKYENKLRYMSGLLFIDYYKNKTT